MQVGHRPRHEGGHDRHRDQRRRVLQRRGGAEIHAAAEPLLVDAAGGQSQQRDDQQHDHGVDATDHQQPLGARGQHRQRAQDQGGDAHGGEAFAQEEGGQQRGGDRVHRDDDGTQHRGGAVHQRQVQADELHGLGQQATDHDMNQPRASGPFHTRGQCPGGQDRGRQAEPEHQRRHGCQGRNSKGANGIAQCIDEGQERRGTGWHGVMVRVRRAGVQ